VVVGYDGVVIRLPIFVCMDQKIEILGYIGQLSLQGIESLLIGIKQ
jgi:hypothetical protein